MGLPGRYQVPALWPEEGTQLGPRPVQPRHSEEGPGCYSNGDVAQLGECLDGIQKVEGSNPFVSTKI